MDKQKVIEVLKQECERNKIFNAVMHVCALRKRARSSITVTGLAIRMRKEGFNYVPSDYSATLKILASVGLGTAKANSRGKVVALTNINVSLQSIGRAALGKSNSFIPYMDSPQPTYSNLVPLSSKPVVEAPKKPQAEPKTQTDLALVVRINGKPVNINIPPSYSTSEVAFLISRLQAV